MLRFLCSRTASEGWSKVHRRLPIYLWTVLLNYRYCCTVVTKQNSKPVLTKEWSKIRNCQIIYTTSLDSMGNCCPHLFGRYPSVDRRRRATELGEAFSLDDVDDEGLTEEPPLLTAAEIRRMVNREVRIRKARRDKPFVGFGRCCI